MSLTLEPILFGFLVVTAIMVAIETNLSLAMLTGMFSLISACLFTLMDAVDVAFTEASVGAGISTVLILGTLAGRRRPAGATNVPVHYLSPRGGYFGNRNFGHA